MGVLDDLLNGSGYGKVAALRDYAEDQGLDFQPNRAFRTERLNRRTRNTINKLIEDVAPPLRRQAKTIARTSRILPRKQAKSMLKTTLEQLPYLMIQSEQLRQQAKDRARATTFVAEWLRRNNTPALQSAYAQAAGIKNMIPSVDSRLQPVLENAAIGSVNRAQQLSSALVNSFLSQQELDAYDQQARLASQLGMPVGQGGGGRY